MLTFNNPLGFWALLTIPAILAIHFLQRKSIILPISTLFLLDQMQRESISGRRIERLRPSVPLWMQLLMGMLFTWMLVQPRWLEKSKVQRVVVILDGSISMQAFSDTMQKELPKELGSLAKMVMTTEYVLIDSRLEEEQIYNGTSLGDLTAALAEWSPTGGSHDLNPAIRLARNLVGKDGIIVLVTDHVRGNLPFGVKTFALGTAIENVGFAGLTMEERDGQWLWKATLKNYGVTEQKRNWWTTNVNGKTSPKAVVIPAGKGEALQGIFPPGVNSLIVHTYADAFKVDDSLPILLPKPKRLAVHFPREDVLTKAETQVYRQLFQSLNDVTLTTDAAKADIQVVAYDPLNPVLPAKPALVFVRDARKDLLVLDGDIIPEVDPLVDGLNWQSLICLDTNRIPMKAADESLLWQKDRSLIFRRGEGASLQLLFNFDFRHANAHKLPAFIVLVHRYFETIRSHLPIHETRNCETGERLLLACEFGEAAPPLKLSWQQNGSEKSASIKSHQATLVRAPGIPGEFRVHQGEKELMHGASHFADTREADFSKAATLNELAAAESAQIGRQSREDSHWQLAVLLTALAALAGWWFVQQGKFSPKTTAPT